LVIRGWKKQIPSLRCGMTARKATATASAKAKEEADSFAALRNDSQKGNGDGKCKSKRGSRFLAALRDDRQNRSAKATASMRFWLVF
jgi:hypothetical protein